MLAEGSLVPGGGAKLRLAVGSTGFLLVSFGFLREVVPELRAGLDVVSDSLEDEEHSPSLEEDDDELDESSSESDEDEEPLLDEDEDDEESVVGG